jgi:hypothetical protein
MWSLWDREQLKTFVKLFQVSYSLLIIIWWYLVYQGLLDHNNRIINTISDQIKRLLQCANLLAECSGKYRENTKTNFPAESKPKTSPSPRLEVDISAKKNKNANHWTTLLYYFILTIIKIFLTNKPILDESTKKKLDCKTLKVRHA